MGVVFTPEGIAIAGGLLNMTSFSLSSALISFKRQGPLAFSGHYQPLVAGNWTVQVRISLRIYAVCTVMPLDLVHFCYVYRAPQVLLQPDVASAFQQVQVNGVCETLQHSPEESHVRVSWVGAGGGGSPLSWALGLCPSQTARGADVLVLA